MIEDRVVGSGPASGSEDGVRREPVFVERFAPHTRTTTVVSHGDPTVWVVVILPSELPASTLSLSRIGAIRLHALCGNAIYTLVDLCGIHCRYGRRAPVRERWAESR